VLTGEKELIDCGQSAMDIFSALKDEFKVTGQFLYTMLGPCQTCNIVEQLHKIVRLSCLT